ncbi:MAG TPA: tetratricopeptide repeat protein [Gammaproteobacteria bacterium]|nr:tetratricopeptide repeat protein [Gammaproteobacteria bacterium]
MSVINQMLKDLEERSSQAAQADQLLIGLQSIASQKHKKTKKYLFMMALFSLSVIWLWNLSEYYRHHHPLPLLQQKSQPKAAVVTPVQKPPINHIETQGIKTALTGISMQTHGKMTYLRFLLDREVVYEVKTNSEEHSVILTLKNTQLTVNLPPLDYMNSALRDLQIRSTANQGLELVLLLKPEARLSNLELNKESQYPELQADFLMEALIQKSDEKSTQLKKVALALSSTEQYEEALHFVETGEIDKALDRLASLVTAYPAYYAARESLIKLFIQAGQPEKATALLAEGLQLQPYYPPFIEVKARFLVEEGKTSQALQLLKKAPPSLATYPEYFAFMAALYQRLGQLPAAEELYQQLTLLHPEKGVWWLGLGVTEEGLGKTAQAKEAYTKADSSLDLDPELRGYVGLRLRG